MGWQPEWFIKITMGSRKSPWRQLSNKKERPVENFLALVKEESWRRVVKPHNYTESNSLSYSTLVYVDEVSGASYDRSTNQESKRQDAVLFIPMLIVQTLPAGFNPVTAGFHTYRRGKLPITLLAANSVSMEIESSELVISINGTNESTLTIRIGESDPVVGIVRNCKNLSLGIPSKNELQFTRVSTDEVNSPPLFPMRTGGLLNREDESIRRLDEAAELAARYKSIIPTRPDSYLDSKEGASNYDVYQSTSGCYSLPNVTRLGGICWACAKQETTREHCSPKWLADYYKVEPLVAPILCGDCNGYFGAAIESRMAEVLRPPITRISEEEWILIVVWSIKTALTMSLASGVRFHPSWLNSLRNGRVPDGFKVYFDPRLSLNEQGFNYGVSKFSDRLVAEGAFLFTLSTPAFTMCVIREVGNSVEVPLLEIYPKIYSEPSVLMSGAFADMHQQIHESISGQITIPNDLPLRKQAPRS